jgi:hypothetical protein
MSSDWADSVQDVLVGFGSVAKVGWKFRKGREAEVIARRVLMRRGRELVESVRVTIVKIVKRLVLTRAADVVGRGEMDCTMG